MSVLPLVHQHYVYVIMLETRRRFNRGFFFFPGFFNSFILQYWKATYAVKFFLPKGSLRYPVNDFSAPASKGKGSFETAIIGISANTFFSKTVFRIFMNLYMMLEGRKVQKLTKPNFQKNSHMIIFAFLMYLVFGHKSVRILPK